MALSKSQDTLNFKVHRSSYTAKRWRHILALLINWTETETVEIVYIATNDILHYSIKAPIWVFDLLNNLKDTSEQADDTPQIKFTFYFHAWNNINYLGVMTYEVIAKNYATASARFLNVDVPASKIVYIKHEEEEIQ